MADRLDSGGSGNKGTPFQLGVWLETCIKLWTRHALHIKGTVPERTCTASHMNQRGCGFYLIT